MPPMGNFLATMATRTGLNTRQVL